MKYGCYKIWAQRSWSHMIQACDGEGIHVDADESMSIL